MATINNSNNNNDNNNNNNADGSFLSGSTTTVLVNEQRIRVRVIPNDDDDNNDDNKNNNKDRRRLLHRRLMALRFRNRPSQRHNHHQQRRHHQQHRFNHRNPPPPHHHQGQHHQRSLCPRISNLMRIPHPNANNHHGSNNHNHHRADRSGTNIDVVVPQQQEQQPLLLSSVQQQGQHQPVPFDVSAITLDGGENWNAATTTAATANALPNPRTADWKNQQKNETQQQQQQQQQQKATNDDDDDIMNYSSSSSSSSALPVSRSPSFLFSAAAPAFSPSGIYRQEVALSKQHVSSDMYLHRFWLPSGRQVEAALQSLHDRYAGHVLHSTSYTMFLEERIDNETTVIVPNYIATLTPSSSSSPFTEQVARAIFQQTCDAVQILHWHAVIHRNLHLNHILVNPNTGKVSLRGFQHITALDYDEDDYNAPFPWYSNAPLQNQAQRMYDWYAFRAPELDREETHSFGVDVWSLGAVLYMLLTGLPPFRGSGSVLQRNKHFGQYAEFDIVQPSLAAQDLISHMLQPDPALRYSLEQVLQHQWFNNDGDRTNGNKDVSDLSLAQLFMQDWSRKAKKTKATQQKLQRQQQGLRASGDGANNDYNANDTITRMDASMLHSNNNNNHENYTAACGPENRRRNVNRRPSPSGILLTS